MRLTSGAQKVEIIHMSHILSSSAPNWRPVPASLPLLALTQTFNQTSAKSFQTYFIFPLGHSPVHFRHLICQYLSKRLSALIISFLFSPGSFYTLWRFIESLLKNCFSGYIPASAVFFFPFIYLSFIYFYLCIFREQRREGERQGEKHRCVRDTLIGCLSHAPNWGPGLQPRHVP